MLYGQTQYGLGQYGQQEQTEAPSFRAQSPAPGATSVSADSSLYFEVYQIPKIFSGDSTKIYVNGTLAVSGSRAMSGFTVARVSTSEGFAYTVSLPDPFETGIQTVRGVDDSVTPSMDETYTFTTAELLVTPEDIEKLINQDSGLDLLLGSSDHDIGVSLADLSLVAGADEVAQHVGVGLRLFRGEWYLDDTAGVPYYQQFFVAGPSTRAIETTLRQEVLDDPDVDSLDEFEMEVDKLTRKLSVSFVAESTYGEIEVDAVFP